MNDDQLRKAITGIMLILRKFPYPGGFAFKVEATSDGLGLIVRDLHTGDWIELRRVV